MDRALIGSPPVSNLMRDSARCLPSSVSETTTSLAPCESARPAGCCSFFVAVSFFESDRCHRVLEGA